MDREGGQGQERNHKVQKTFLEDPGKLIGRAGAISCLCVFV